MRWMSCSGASWPLAHFDALVTCDDRCLAVIVVEELAARAGRRVAPRSMELVGNGVLQVRGADEPADLGVAVQDLGTSAPESGFPAVTGDGHSGVGL